MLYFPFLNNSSKYPVNSLVREDNPRRILIDTQLLPTWQDRLSSALRYFLGRRYRPQNRMPPTAPCKAKPDLFLFFSIDRKSTRLNSSHANISYAVFCLKKKTPTSFH